VKRTKTYDTKSFELAEHFLSDDPSIKDPELHKMLCHKLAIEIQEAVEDWFWHREPENME
jgi:hypothetical protein